jgi:type IV pilus assembly protein PilQ
MTAEKNSADKNRITAIESTQGKDALDITLKGTAAPNYTVYELFKPARIVVDVADTTLAVGVAFELPKKSQVKLTTSTITDTMPPLTRFTFTLPESRQFTVKEKGKDIFLKIAGGQDLPEKAKTEATTEKTVATIAANETKEVTTPKETGKQDAVSRLIKQKQMIESQLPTIDASQRGAEEINAKSVADSMKDAFNFSGYNKERITVDFYKIDLHNVFRLIREISKTNIIVDDSVSGSLTLALNDVPWDFALDIILNLKDLQKEERFNTIVIHPKSKAFDWPKRAEDNLSFETDEKVTEQEAILIQQQMTIPKTVIAAKQYIVKGHSFEQKEEFEMAIAQYKAALKKWPDNARLASKIASIYLVQLRQNAKALYFAKKALEINHKLTSAALTAGIAAANMQDNKQALRYFDLAVQGKKPLREALLSYAAFSEQQKQYAGALKLIKRQDVLYGENLTSMITRARILDKEGKHADATGEYKKIIYSGYRIAPDLKKFIQGRLALSQTL